MASGGERGIGRAWVGLAILAAIACASPGCGRAVPGGEPVAVRPAHDGAARDVARDAARSEPSRPGAGGDALWVMDAGGVPVGVLVRRGSDGQLASDAYYDIVTVFDPASGLFFEITMSDGIVRLPGETFFSDAACTRPVGVSIGACPNCHAGYGVGFIGGGAWWKLEGGSSARQARIGSYRKGGINTDCGSHPADNARLFPAIRVSGLTPPLHFTAPLYFAWR